MFLQYGRVLIKSHIQTHDSLRHLVTKCKYKLINTILQLSIFTEEIIILVSLL